MLNAHRTKQKREALVYIFRVWPWNMLSWHCFSMMSRNCQSVQIGKDQARSEDIHHKRFEKG